MKAEQTAEAASTVLPFDYEETPIRVVLGDDGEPWFVAADIGRVLELNHPRDAVALLEEDEKGVEIIDTLGGPQKMGVVNESGLYTLIFRSNKPQAKKFRRWVTAVVLPTIRRTGRFEMPGFSALSPVSPAALLDRLDEIARLIRLTNARDPAGALARESLSLIGFRIPPPAQAPGVSESLDFIIAYIFDNAGTAFPDHHAGKTGTVAVNWPEMAKAAARMGVPFPAHPPSELRDHPLVERFNWPVCSAALGKKVKCLILRRPQDS